MEKNRFNTPWIGIALIAVGVAMVLRRAHVLYVEWEAVAWGILALAGAIKLAVCFSRRSRRGAFWGTIFLSLGAYMLLDDLDVLAYGASMVPPVLVLAMGIGFLIMLILSPRELHVAVPGLFFTGLGALMVLYELGYVYNPDVLRVVGRYWPVALIVFGVSLLANRRMTGRE